MYVDHNLFMKQGFLIFKNLIPREQLPELRWKYETALEVQKLQWAKEAGPDDPPGGHWETSAMPTLDLDTVMEPQTAAAMEFCLGENTLGISEQLMQNTAAPLTMQMLCSPIVDVGHSNWHRDVDSINVAPYEGLSLDTQANGPGLLQWNIPLYDDDVFWVVPGSHLRPETEAEAQQLLSNAQVPLPNSEPVKLKAGDAVVYTNILLHWGSLYTAKLRRTIHLSYRSFGGQLLPHYHVSHYSFDYGFVQHLSPAAQTKFYYFRDLYAKERNDIESLMRAIIELNEVNFHAGIAILHPGKKGRMVTLILLSQWVKLLIVLTRTDVRNLALIERANITNLDPTDVPYYADVADRFTAQEGQILAQRFAGLEAQLATDRQTAYTQLEKKHKGLEPIPGDLSSFDFHQRSTRTLYSAMPTAFGLDEFVASWDQP